MNAPHRTLHEIIRPTTWIEAPRLSQQLGIDLLLASEAFQYTGSFKFRAAHQVAAGTPHPMILTASSGNFGQALAYACHRLHKTALVVMPETSARVKIEAVRHWGARIDFIDVRKTSRRDRVQALARLHPEAYVASAYDDPHVIQGNASLGVELSQPPRPVDAVLAPIGGGGLISGLITGLASVECKTPVYAVEPVVANDAARSWRAGKIIALESEPPTLADGVRTLSVGLLNWPILHQGLAGVIEVPEPDIAAAVRLLFLYANLKAEPTGALALAALLAAPDRFRGQSVCVVVSGGNVDPDVYRSILRGSFPPLGKAKGGQGRISEP